MIRDFRAATRFLVRELHTLNGKSVLDDATFSECHCLIELGANDGCSVADLCEALVLDKSTVSRIVTSLRKKGLATSEPDPGDRRAVRVRLSSEGRAKLDLLHERADRDVAQAMGYLFDDDMKVIQEAFLAYAKALRYARVNREWTVRPIEPRDNAAVGAIIRQVMAEFGAVGCGYSIEDPEVDDMYASYQERAAYWVVENENGVVVGGAGFGPLVGATEWVCELKKMYFLSEARGRGLAMRLIRLCLERAVALGYRQCYLETLDHMHQAQRLYRKAGFTHRTEPLGNTGHFKCNTWMVKDLQDDDNQTLPLQRAG